MWILVLTLISCEDKGCRSREIAVMQTYSEKGCRAEASKAVEQFSPLYTKVFFRCERD